MNETKIGIIGLGNMGKAIASGLSESGFSNLVGYDPHQTKFPTGIRPVSSLGILTEEADVVVLAVKPAQVVSVCREIQRSLTLHSIAAGVSLEQIRGNLPSGSRVVRLMPNLPLLVQEGAIGYFCEDAEVGSVTQIWKGLGSLVRVSEEKLMDAVTGLSGSGPAYVFTFLHALAEGGVKSGLSYSDALELAWQTVKGSLEYFRELQKEKSALHPMELRNQVTSPGGTTIYGLDALERGGFSTAVRDAVFEASLRSKELGK